MAKKVICVIGTGSWGTALALVLARSNRDVRLVASDEAQAEAIITAGENRQFLPGIPIPDSIHVTADLHSALQGIDACVYALPCAAADAFLPPLADGSYPVISACKGLHPESLIRTDQMLAEHIAPERIAILSGPSFAMEVARDQPTAITMAAATIALAEKAASFFDDSNFRIYTSDDVIGVALGGALKNVVAIAAGVAEGLHYGHNSVAAIVTRGLAEMARLCEACGGQFETMMGLSGLGDLVLTCTGDLSRNRQFGMAIAKGKSCEEAVKEIGQVVEGIRTAQAVNRLATQLNLELPLLQSVHLVLTGALSIEDAVGQLMARPERSEF